MISCNLQGGLGNQLFQIYTTIAYASDTGSKFFFFKVYDLKNLITNRHTYWDTFLSRLKPFLLDPELIDKKKSNLVIIREKGFTYNALPFPVPEKKIKILNGYFQSPKYFDMYYQTINRLLKIDDHKVRLTNKYLKLINEDLPISMHFRLGDYKKLPNNYVILSIDYYRTALNCILEATKLTNKTNKVLYFCEDQDLEDVDPIIATLKDEFRELIFERADPTLEDWEQLIMMSLCRNNIIANSTFSWWGAYLNVYRHKIVVCPLTWFGPKMQQTHNLKDLYPESWIKI
jgi:hypothetical protein